MKHEVAMKNDAGKPTLALFPKSAMFEICEVLGKGAEKYEAHNWRKGYPYSRGLSAALRHIYQYLDGEDKDSETGNSHLAHACCMLVFMLEHEHKGYGVDDRYKEEQ
jgi:hypothetical protein